VAAAAASWPLGHATDAISGVQSETREKPRVGGDEATGSIGGGDGADGTGISAAVGATMLWGV
jgi:hypothetical protein